MVSYWTQYLLHQYRDCDRYQYKEPKMLLISYIITLAAVVYASGWIAGYLEVELIDTLIIALMIFTQLMVLAAIDYIDAVYKIAKK
jgi:hypothetical protein